MKDILDIFIETMLVLLLWGMGLYALLSFAAYTAAADEVLTPDERIVALTILGEARGEGNMGMYAVACVIQERSIKRKLTPAQVCHQPWQFSIWNAGKGKIKKENELWDLWKSTSVPYARELARHICKGNVFARGTIGNANHYHAKSVKPYWTYKKIKRDNKIIRINIKPTKIIGNHIFYKL